MKLKAQMNINYVLRFLFFVAHSLCLSCQLFLWLRGGILRTVLVLVSLKFIVLQEQRKDQTPSPKITFTGKKVFLFEACYFDLSLCLFKAMTWPCCTGFCTSSFSVVLLSICFSLFGCLPLQDRQTVQHKSDWQCITAAMCFSFTHTYDV